jgi:hypothetical protein
VGKGQQLGELWGSHSDKFETDSLLGCCAM